MSEIRERLDAIRAQVKASAAAAGRSPGEVELIAVSKNHPPEAIEEAFRCGQSVFGESRVQEARIKVPILSSSIRWHFIGHLQKNKIRHALPLFDLFHSVDSLGLAQQINRIASELGLSPRVLLEVNVAGEASKYGFSPEDVPKHLEELLFLDRLRIEGLMTIAPYSDDPENSRRPFAQLRELRDSLQDSARIVLPSLSMGMSGDFLVAIEEGATMVRIGTSIFGARPYRKEE
jgi:PLP dependent protein